MDNMRRKTSSVGSWEGLDMRESRTVPDAIVMAIGKIAIATAGLDILMGCAVESIREALGEVADNTIMGASARRKSEQLVQLIPTDDMKALMVEVEQVLADRNLAVHGLMAHGDHENPMPNTFLIWRGKYKTLQQPVTLEFLSGIDERARGLSKQLFQIAVLAQQQASLDKP